jgi:hypothetical protein
MQIAALCGFRADALDIEPRSVLKNALCEACPGRILV